MCLLDFFKGVRKGGKPVKLHILFSGIVVGRFKYGKMCDHKMDKLFANNSVEALIREIKSY